MRLAADALFAMVYLALVYVGIGAKKSACFTPPQSALGRKKRIFLPVLIFEKIGNLLEVYVDARKYVVIFFTKANPREISSGLL